MFSELQRNCLRSGAAWELTLKKSCDNIKRFKRIRRKKIWAQFSLKIKPSSFYCFSLNTWVVSKYRKIEKGAAQSNDSKSKSTCCLERKVTNCRLLWTIESIYELDEVKTTTLNYGMQSWCILIQKLDKSNSSHAHLATYWAIW